MYRDLSSTTVLIALTGKPRQSHSRDAARVTSTSKVHTLFENNNFQSIVYEKYKQKEYILLI